MRLINEQPVVLRADWLEATVEATGREEFQERCDEQVCLGEGRRGGSPEGLVPPRRAPAPVASARGGASR